MRANIDKVYHYIDAEPAMHQRTSDVTDSIEWEVRALAKLFERNDHEHDEYHNDSHNHNNDHDDDDDDDHHHHHG